MKYAAERYCSDPDRAARRLLEIANSVEPVQDGHIHIEKINGPFLKEASPAEHKAGRPRRRPRLAKHTTAWTRSIKAEAMAGTVPSRMAGPH
jgi:hypothetical protein